MSLLQMYVTRRGGGVEAGLRFRPLKNIQVDGKPSEEFFPVKFQPPSYGSLQAEMMTKEYGDRATGASDYMMGFENKAVGTRSTAQGTQFLAAQNQSQLEGNMEGPEDDFAKIGEITVYQSVLNRDKAMEIASSLLDEKYLEPLSRALSTPPQDIPSKFIFQTNTTEIDESEDARRQNMITLTGLYMQYGQQSLQLLNMLAQLRANKQLDPEVEYFATKLYTGGTQMMSDVVEALGNRDPETFVPYVKNIQMMLEEADRMRERAAQKMEAQSRVREDNAVLQSENRGGGAAPNLPEEPVLPAG